MSITPLPSLDRTSASFKSDVDTFFGTKMPTFCTEMNAAIAALNLIAAGTACAIPYTFSTTTTDADPGAGYLRLGSATQNTATVIRADLVGADGSTWTNVIDTFDDSTSTIKGHIMLQKLGDATKWLLFSVSSLASPSGYKNITVANVASSASSPFADGDQIILKFTRNGDAGTAAALGNHEVVLHSGNGHGSTNTMIRRYATALVNTGTAMTYADSAANGMSITINESGLYNIYMTDRTAGASPGYGVSVNSSQLTISIASITTANRIMQTYPVSDKPGGVSRTVYLTAGDVIRAHTDSTPTVTDDRAYFAIRKVGVIT